MRLAVNGCSRIELAPVHYANKLKPSEGLRL